MVRGIDASRAFYERAVAPLLEGIPHAAGRIGRGSDVLGLDDEMSRDHDWGDRVTVITEHETPPLPEGVELHTLQHFVTSHLGCDPVDDIDWLLLTGQSVLEVIAGAVFRDDTGALTALRAKLQWYPPDVERYLIAASWRPLDSEAAICAALDELAGRPVCVQFHDRPFRTVDPLFLATMPSDGIGSVEMWCDNVDVLSQPWRRMGLRSAYEAFRA